MPDHLILTYSQRRIANASAVRDSWFGWILSVIWARFKAGRAQRWSITNARFQHRVSISESSMSLPAPIAQKKCSSP
jgi:hypothetical protein